MRALCLLKQIALHFLGATIAVIALDAVWIAVAYGVNALRRLLP